MKKALRILAIVLVLAIAATLVIKNNVDKDYYDDYDYDLPLQAQVVEQTEAEGYRLEKVTFAARAGESVPALIALPAAKTAPVPMVIFLHGIGQDKDFLTDICKPFTDAGFGIASFDQFMRGERKLQDPGRWEEVKAFRARGWKTVNDTRRLVDYLATRDDVNINRLYLVGASYGAITGATALRFEERIAAGVLVYGGADVGLLLDSKVGREELGNLLPVAKAFGKFYLGVMDPARYAHDIAPRPVLLQNGREDSIISVAAAEALQNAVQEPKEVIWYDSDHPDDPALVERILGDALAWIEKQDARIAGTLSDNAKELAAAGTDPALAPLLHTTWKVGGTYITFIAPDKAHVRGGPIAAIAPDGLKVSVRYGAGEIGFSALGQDRSGTWDGSRLIIDGFRAKRVWEDPEGT